MPGAGAEVYGAPMRLTVFFASALLGAACRTPSAAPSAANARPACRCAPEAPCWPEPVAWQALAAHLTGKLEQPASPTADCRTDAAGPGCLAALGTLEDPFSIQEQAGATESTGWLGAWTSAPSAYAVAAENVSDIAAAVAFAHQHHLRLVVKGAGHDYLGRSSAPGSLLVWTHRMRSIAIDDAFVPAGCPGTEAGVPAVSVQAGARWGEVYEAVAVKHGRYVQGGGCTSVGAAGGFLQGGGFGSFSKKFGTGAANALEMEVVTADGRIVIANRCQHSDLFWALRGGGGGTFGVVSRVTLMTHPLPETFGAVGGTITAKTDEAFATLLEAFVRFYRARLSEEHWGEQNHGAARQLSERVDALRGAERAGGPRRASTRSESCRAAP